MQFRPIANSSPEELIDSLLPALTKLVHSCIIQTTIPQTLKAACVTPLIKKTTLDCNDTKNYRPVSNLSYVSKLVEKVIFAQLHQHLTSNDLYQRDQSAYRKHHSTETALVKICDYILTELDKNQCVFLVLLDQSAAFDTVHQDLLLHKLCCRYGITESALTLLSSYFKGRTQSVMIDGTSSEPKELKTGFPQGSVLGPYMYPLYASELFEIAQ